MKTHLSLQNEKKHSLPEEFGSDDVRYTEELVEHFLVEYTKSGDTVFDPFLGFGTTLLVAERMGRSAYGVEYDERRCLYVRSLAQHPERCLHGDSTRLSSLDLPDFDFSMTSPPYMGKAHKEDPFTAYSTEGQGYSHYLSTFRTIYRQINEKLRPGGHVVIEVSNLKHEDGSLTTLAWDIATEVSKVLRFTGEIVVNWDNYGFGYDHSYCLTFAKQ